MEQIERYIKEVCRGLRVPEALRGEIGEELRAHLLESVQAHVDAGMPEEEAAASALAEFGQVDAVRGELKAAYGGSLLTLLIQRAMDWREKTMKTGWKWSFVAQLALVVMLVVGYLALLCWARFLIPPLVQGYRELNAPLTHLGGIAPALIRFSSFLVGTWYVWPILLALGWGIFEWRCRSVNKETIRLASGAVACLATTIVVCVFSTSTMIMCADLMVGALSQRAPRHAEHAAVEAQAPLAGALQALPPAAR